MNRSVLLVPLAAATILLAAPRPAAACSCAMPPAPKVALEQASAVFQGKVVKVDQYPEKHHTSARFAVTRWWKGGGTAETSVATIDMGSMCGIEVKVGDEWLIYATGAEDQLSTSMCSRSRRRADVEGDFKALGAGRPADPSKPSPPPSKPAEEPAPAEPPPAEPTPAEPAPVPAPETKVEPSAPASPAAPQPAATQGCSVAGAPGLAWVVLFAGLGRRRARRGG